MPFTRRAISCRRTTTPTIAQALECLEDKRLLTAGPGQDLVLDEDFEDLDTACWDDHLASSSGYNTLGCDGFVNIGDGQNIQLIETPDARSGDTALRVTYGEDEDVGQAVYKIDGTDYVRTTQYMRFNDTFDFGFGQKIHRIFSVDENEDVNFDIVVVAWGEALEGKAKRDLSGVNGEVRFISMNYNGGKEALDWGGAWTDDFNFERETWHKITSEVQLNTVGAADGWVRLFVDDVLVAERRDLEIRGNADQEINQVLFGGWYSNSAAGENPEPNPASPTNLLIDDVSIATTPGDVVPLERPSVLTPSGNQTTNRPEISWSVVDGADEYEVRLTNLETQAVIFEEVTTQTSLIPTDELVDGAWQVQVRARNSESVSDWASSRFDIRTNTGERTVIIDEDFENGTIDGFNVVTGRGATSQIVEGQGYSGGTRVQETIYPADESQVKLEVVDLQGAKSVELAYATRLPDGIPTSPNDTVAYANLKQSHVWIEEPGELGLTASLWKYDDSPNWDMLFHYGVGEGRHHYIPVTAPIDGWLHVRYFVSWNTVGQEDGVLMVWMNDELVIDEHDVTWTNTEGSSPEGLWVGGNLSRAGNPPATPFRRWTDDITVAINGSAPDTRESFLEVDGDKLIVAGSESDDIISIREAADSISVTLNGQTETVSGLGISTIVVRSFDGADEISRTGDTQRKAVIYTGPGDDTVSGGLGRDVVRAGSGDDVIAGLGGDDVVRAGAGNDSVVGGSGDDTLNGGSGSDSLFGDEGNDLLRGHKGPDHLFGGTGDDELDGGRGHDVIMGGVGSDRLTGDAGRNLLVGGEGSDWIDGILGDDIIVSGSTNLDPAQLATISQQWRSRQNYNSRLGIVRETIPNAFQTDSSTDTLTSGEDDVDWFFANSVDSISGKTLAEQLDLL